MTYRPVAVTGAMLAVDDDDVSRYEYGIPDIDTLGCREAQAAHDLAVLTDVHRSSRADPEFAARSHGGVRTDREPVGAVDKGDRPRNSRPRPARRESRSEPPGQQPIARVLRPVVCTETVHDASVAALRRSWRIPTPARASGYKASFY
jgi:hypothetical protein